MIHHRWQYFYCAAVTASKRRLSSSRAFLYIFQRTFSILFCLRNRHRLRLQNVNLVRTTIYLPEKRETDTATNRREASVKPERERERRDCLPFLSLSFPFLALISECGCRDDVSHWSRESSGIACRLSQAGRWLEKGEGKAERERVEREKRKKEKKERNPRFEISLEERKIKNGFKAEK